MGKRIKKSKGRTPSASDTRKSNGETPSASDARKSIEETRKSNGETPSVSDARKSIEETTSASSGARKSNGEISSASAAKKARLEDTGSSKSGEKMAVLICMIPLTPDRGPIVVRKGFDDERAAFPRIFPPNDPSFRFPIHLVRDFGYTIAFLQSKLYFLGGYQVCDRPNLQLLLPPLGHTPLPAVFLPPSYIYSSDVYVFDLGSKKWQDGFPSMQKPRTDPVALTYRNNLYVFGSLLHYDCQQFSLSPDTYAEYYDFSAREWSYLPPAPLRMLEPPRHHINSYSYSESGELVYFLIYEVGIFSYSFSSKSWSSFTTECPELHPSYGCLWSSAAVLSDTHLIWHHFGVIYSYNFSTQKVIPVYNFKNPSKKFGLIEDMRYPAPSYLLHIGTGKLCLVYGKQHFKDTESVRYHTFDLSAPEDDNTEITIAHEACKDFSPPEGYTILSVLTTRFEDFQLTKASED